MLRAIYHYLIILRSGLFDRSYYLLTYPDVRRADVDPIWHFVRSGWQEGRDPSRDFNTTFYLNNNPDVKQQSLNPLIHFILFGKKEGRITNKVSSQQYQQSKEGFAFTASLFWGKNQADQNRELSIEHITQELEHSKKKIDVIIPIYNGMEFLPSLFASLKKNTRLPYRLILINDKSPDERIQPYLEETSREFDEVLLINNEENQGFVRSVNIAAKQARHHFVILNSDVEVPEGWLERIIEPIIQDEKIASTTPFTNAGTICSFPEMAKDNELFLGLTLNEIDSVFSRVNPAKIVKEIPTGVGFCMGINLSVWKEIGAFDDVTFELGYGEENDWCRRAAAKGYTNIIVPNLFVYHKHGGSFSPEKKKEQTTRNIKKLLALHPDYNKIIRDYISDDPLKPVREYASFLLMKESDPKETVLVVDHNLGGGASTFRENLIKETLSKDCLVLLFYYDKPTSLFKLHVHFQDIINKFDLLNINEISLLFEKIDIDKMIINNLVSYPDSKKTINVLNDVIRKFDPYTIVYIHDYYFLCPTINLINKDDQFCDLPPIEVCNACLPENRFRIGEITDIEEWRAPIRGFFENCDEVVCFSESSKELMTRIYPIEGKLHVRPHKVLTTFAKKPVIDFNAPLNIGVIGAIGVKKGLNIIREVAKILRTEQPEARITIIGRTGQKVDADNITVTGPYELEKLPEIIENHHVNICFFSSIIPETFSFVVSEIILLELPLCAFNIGAPAERVAKYEHGRLLSKIEPRTAADEILAYFKAFQKQNMKK